MFVVTAFVICLLCLVFNSTRLVGVFGLTLLAYLFPLLLIPLLVLGGVVWFFTQHK